MRSSWKGALSFYPIHIPVRFYSASLSVSGGKRLQVYVPFRGKYEYKIVKKFDFLIAEVLQERMLSLISLEHYSKKRQKKMYNDILQNQKMQTVVAAYSVRGFSHAPIPNPFQWKEVKQGLDPNDFNLRTIPKRLAQKGHLFHSIFKEGISLQKTLNKLGGLS